jgi:aryl-alcohol dehydrogenase-like predicted oxidoreductase
MTVAEQVAAERELADTLDQYSGQWVAIRDHAVVASAETLEELREQIEAQDESVEIFRVARHPHAACFF